MELERNDREPAAGDGSASRQHDAYSGPGAAGTEEVARTTDQQAVSAGEAVSLINETARGVQMSLTDAPNGALAEPTQVLELELGKERHHVVLDAITEIIGRTSARSPPDSPPHVVGAVDYRGATTEPTVPYSLERSREPLGR